METENELKKQVAARNRSYRRTLSGRLSRAAESANKLAKEQGLEGRVTTDQLKDLFQQQGGLCLFTGRSLTADNPDADSHLSLDHIVAANCKSGVATGSVENMALVRLPVNRIKYSLPLCEMFGKDVPVLTRFMTECLSEDRQKEIIDLQYRQLKALGKGVVKGQFTKVGNYRRRNTNRRTNKTKN